MTDVATTHQADPTGYSLASKYQASHGDVFMTGVQALARLPIEQLRRDHLNDKHTAALVSGYPGSPLGGYDLELARALKHNIGNLNIRHLPAVNEELAATAVMGSQLVADRHDALVDGVVGIWYGKAPGLDRATDALRHGVFAGSSATGGAIALVGDDPGAKSSTMPSSSDAALVDLHMPILYPANPMECLELGMHGIEMSRATGLWSALKIVTAVADGSGIVSLPVLAQNPIIPIHEVDGVPWTCQPSAQFLGPRMVEVEREFHEIRTNLALRYGQQNAINHIHGRRDAWMGMVATGFTFLEVIEAFRRLGFPTMESITGAGIRLLNLRMPIPFDAELVGRFARGLEQIFVVEEKNPTLERLVRDALYTTSMRPRVFGKTGRDGPPRLPSFGRLDADSIVPPLRACLEPRLGERIAPPEPAQRERIPLAVERAPFFCSGCPHNWGTKVPQGAVVGMGTGCHGMTLLMDQDRVGDSIGITAMGNEGAQWLGMAPFVATDHVFQNLGDGTYMHSAQLAVQAAIGAGANVTFKILYNHTIAMTGGQDAAHMVGPTELSAILLAHGVKKVVISTDDVASYRHRNLPPDVEVHARDKIVALQSELASIRGVTVLIHDQECAAELRRDRKRGLREQPNTRVVINHRICEGCGDCGDVSNCLSVQPVQTALGRKTQIDQSSCNFDYSCMHGDCPAFMTVDAHEYATQEPPGLAQLAARALPSPVIADIGTTVIRLAGIGGTGVVTVAQIVATAATLDGRRVAGLDQTGLSQKAGPVISDLTIWRAEEPPRSNVSGSGQADVLIAFDQLVAATTTNLGVIGAATTVFASTSQTPTGAQITTPELRSDNAAALTKRLTGTASAGQVFEVDALHVSQVLTGTRTTANVLLLGAALQSGQLPVSVQSLQRAIELNGVAVDQNLAALDWGRRLFLFGDEFASDLVVDLLPFTSSMPAASLINRALGLGLAEPATSQVISLVGDLVDYQDQSYASRFLDLVESASDLGSDELTLAVAQGFHKLMAYKDEYEVARLMLHPDGSAGLDATGSNPRWHLHPPILKAVGRNTKISFSTRSTPMFAALARAKRLRGTRFDPFAHTSMRRLERSLVNEYESTMGLIFTDLEPQRFPANLALAIEIALLPDMVRGFEDLKVQRAGQYRTRVAELYARLKASA